MTNLNEEDRADYFNPGHSLNGDSAADEDDETGALFDYSALFDAPDFASMVRGRRSKVAQEYEKRIKSALKSGAIGALRAQDLPDAATILHYGPGFSAALGDVADVNDSVKRMIDIVTAPDNPYIVLAMIALPFAAQFLRNHEETIKQIPDARRRARRAKKEEPADDRKNVILSLPFGRKLSLRLGFRFHPLAKARLLFRVPTHEPQDLVFQVFSDPKLLTALEKQGIHIGIKKM